MLGFRAVVKLVPWWLVHLEAHSGRADLNLNSKCVLCKGPVESEYLKREWVRILADNK